MDSIKQDVVTSVKEAIFDRAEAVNGLTPSHSDAEVEVHDGESLSLDIWVKHPSTQGRRMFEVRIKEVL